MDGEVETQVSEIHDLLQEALTSKKQEVNDFLLDPVNGLQKRLREPDLLVKVLKRDPNEYRSDLVIFIGYLGGAGRDGFCRLYLNATMTEYLEISINDVKHCEKVRNEANPWGYSILWVDVDARVQHTRKESIDQVASFLSGAVARSVVVETDGAALTDGARRARRPEADRVAFGLVPDSIIGGGGCGTAGAYSCAAGCPNGPDPGPTQLNC